MNIELLSTSELEKKLKVSTGEERSAIIAELDRRWEAATITERQCEGYRHTNYRPRKPNYDLA